MVPLTGDEVRQSHAEVKGGITITLLTLGRRGIEKDKLAANKMEMAKCGGARTRQIWINAPKEG